MNWAATILNTLESGALRLQVQIRRRKSGKSRGGHTSHLIIYSGGTSILLDRQSSTGSASRRCVFLSNGLGVHVPLVVVVKE